MQNLLDIFLALHLPCWLCYIIQAWRNSYKVFSYELHKKQTLNVTEVGGNFK